MHTSDGRRLRSWGPPRNNIRAIRNLGAWALGHAGAVTDHRRRVETNLLWRRGGASRASRGRQPTSVGYISL